MGRERKITERLHPDLKKLLLMVKRRERVGRERRLMSHCLRGTGGERREGSLTSQC